MVLSTFVTSSPLSPSSLFLGRGLLPNPLIIINLIFKNKKKFGTLSQNSYKPSQDLWEATI